MRLIIAKDYADVSRKAANIIAAQIYLKPDCVLGLATGSSPVGTYKELIAKYESGDLDFSQVRTVNLDEYVGLPKDHDQSYAYFMRANLFDHVNIDQASPAQMLAILTYAYMNSIFSTRKIEDACRNNIKFMYLLEGKPAPDHATISRFLTKRLQCIFPHRRLLHPQSAELPP